MNKLFISPAAQEDLIEIKRYITEELGNPDSANKVIIRITKRLRILLIFHKVVRYYPQKLVWM